MTKRRELIIEIEKIRKQLSSLKRGESSVEEHQKRKKNLLVAMGGLEVDLAMIRHTSNRYSQKARLKYRSKSHNFLNNYKKNGCIKCGVKDPVVLDFHHVDPTDKSFTISQGVQRMYDEGMIIEEIRKCVLLCSNCHRKEHHSF